MNAQCILTILRVTVSLLGKCVVLADLAADVNCNALTCIAYDNLALQY